MSELTVTQLTDAERAVIDAVPQGLLIGDRWHDASGGRTFDVVDPSTTAALCEVADASSGDAMAALQAAAGAQARWGAHPPRERGEILRRTFEAITARADELALLMTLEMGKPVAESRTEVLYAAEFFRWNAEEAVRIDGGYTVSGDGKGRVLRLRQPVGPCAFITPWNFPMAMGARKIAPAVAAGCTSVIKPAAETPLSMLALAQIMLDAGLPPGVLNVVTTTEPAATMNPVLADPRLRKLSFTGSTEVGRGLLTRAADQVLRVSLELGGNAPFLVFADADLDAAVEGAMVAKMRNMGQACTAANRFLVAGEVAEQFGEQLAERMSKLVCGRGTTEGVNVGPLINAEALDKVSDLVDDAVQRGARVLTGGRRLDGPGYFYEPTVLADVPAGARMLSEEVFGPVAPLRTFSYDAEGIAEANDTEYGLVAYAYTTDLQRAVRVGESLEVGMVGLNQGMVSNPSAPFGGVKQSGLGREGGYEGIHEFLELKFLAMPG